jgi:hypothetical protein
MIELTAEQQQSLSREAEMPPRAVDPSTHTRYVLLPEDAYQRVRQLLESNDERFSQDVMPAVMEAFGRDGWNDPAMDVYDDLDPRNAP